MGYDKCQASVKRILMIPFPEPLNSVVKTTQKKMKGDSSQNTSLSNLMFSPEL